MSRVLGCIPKHTAMTPSKEDFDSGIIEDRLGRKNDRDRLVNMHVCRDGSVPAMGLVVSSVELPIGLLESI